MAFVLGKDHKLYAQWDSNTAPTTVRAAWPASADAPNLNEIQKAKDVSFSGDAETADASTRGGGGFRQMVATLKDGNTEFDLVYDQADADVIFLKNAWLNNWVFGVAILDGPSDTVGTQGIWKDAMVTAFEWTQELEDVGRIPITVVNALSDVPLEWITVGA